MKTNTLIFGCLLAAAGLASCGSQYTMSTLEIRMTDSPGPFTAVNVDVQGLEVTGAGSSNVSLAVTPQIVNLNDLTNGKFVILGSADLEPGEISQLRLILGDNNTVVVDGQTYPLSTPSADQSGLKLQVHKTFEAGYAYKITLDFDAFHSIVETGKGEYKLKPSIRAIVENASGSVKGKISPAGNSAVVVAKGSDGSLYSTPVDASGTFTLTGLPVDAYTISLVYSATSDPKVLAINQFVDLGKIVDLGTINF